MAIKTDLNTKPYNDDYLDADNKNFHRVLFKPSVTVQVRELNQLQSILQGQIEKFGTHVFKDGTIVSGCVFNYIPNMPYIKLRDLDVNNQNYDITDFENLKAKNSNNLIASIVQTIPGLETQNPNLNTLYIRYENTGENLEKEYSPDEILTVFNENINSFTLEVADTGDFEVEDVVTQWGTGARGVVSSIDEDDNIIVVSNTVGVFSNSEFIEENFADDVNITDYVSNVALLPSSNSSVSNNTILGMLVGSATEFSAIEESTDDSIVTSVRAANTNFENSGDGAEEYDVTGFGYGFSISDGIIFQKGHFIRVPAQTTIIEPYNKIPDNLYVGFVTEENIVTSFVDDSLLDNSLGTPNENAPGADRLQLIPNLVVGDASEIADEEDYNILVRWENGQPIRANQSATYNELGREMAKRTSEESGNYVSKMFPVYSENIENNYDYVNIVVGSGVGYVQGYRQELIAPQRIPVEKANTTDTISDFELTSNYGYYIKVNEFTLTSSFSTGSIVWLHNSDFTSISNPDTADADNRIGTAKIRSIQHDSGVPGTPECVYRIYLFDVHIFKGRNFDNIRGVEGDGDSGYADLILEDNLPVIYDKEKASIIVDTFKNGVKSFNDSIKYQFRTRSVATISDTGTITITSPSGSIFPYKPNTVLDSEQKKEIVIINSSGEDYVAEDNSTGTVSVDNANNSILDGTNTLFLTEYRVGDYIQLSSDNNRDTTDEIKRIVSIQSDTSLVLDSDANASVSGYRHWRAFPNGFPINTLRNDVNISVSSASELSVDLDINIDNAGDNGLTVFYTAQKNSIAITAPRQKSIATSLVKIDTTARAFYLSAVNGTLSEGDTIIITGDDSASAEISSIQTDYNTGKQYVIAKNINGTFLVDSDVNVEGETGSNAHIDLISPVPNYSVQSKISGKGPYCLGQPDVFEIVSVKSSDNSYPTSGTAEENKESFNNDSVDVTDDFELILNQKDSHYSLSYAKVKNSSEFNAEGKYLLFEIKSFNYTQGQEGYFSVDSYPEETELNVEDIPVYTSNDGEEYDLRNSIDFRPYVDSTSKHTDDFNNATNTPVSVELYSTDNTAFDYTKYFPVPGGAITTNIEYYLPRKDKIAISSDGELKHIKGSPSENPQYPADLPESMTLADIEVPVYPSLSTQEAIQKQRNDYAITTRLKQIKRYTMKDIGDLEKRIVNIEYYTSLSLLEKSAKDLYIPGAGGTDRFKNGFLVDNYTTFETTDIEHPEFHAAIDPTPGELIPPFENNTFELKIADTSSIMKNGDEDEMLLSLAFTNIEKIQQPKFSSVRETTTYQNDFIGTIELTPSYDNFYDVNSPRNKIAVIDIDTSSPVESLVNNINTALSGQLRKEENLPAVVTTSRGESKTRKLSSGAVQTYRTETTTTVNKVQTKTSKLAVTTQTSREEVGDFVTDISFKPFMRAKKVAFRAAGLRPNARHYIFFDESEVTDLCAMTSIRSNAEDSKFSWGRKSHRPISKPAFAPGDDRFNTIWSNDTGEITGFFYLPEGKFHVGERLFEIADVELYTSIESGSTSYAKAVYHAYNYSATKTSLVTSVRQPEITTQSQTTTSSTSSKTSREVVLSTKPAPRLPTRRPSSGRTPSRRPYVPSGNPASPGAYVPTPRRPSPNPNSDALIFPGGTVIPIRPGTSILGDQVKIPGVGTILLPPGHGKLGKVGSSGSPYGPAVPVDAYKGPILVARVGRKGGAPHSTTFNPLSPDTQARIRELQRRQREEGYVIKPSDIFTGGTPARRPSPVTPTPTYDKETGTTRPVTHKDPVIIVTPPVRPPSPVPKPAPTPRPMPRPAPVPRPEARPRPMPVPKPTPSPAVAKPTPTRVINVFGRPVHVPVVAPPSPPPPAPRPPAPAPVPYTVPFRFRGFTRTRW